MNIETSLKSDILGRFISGSGYFYAPGKVRSVQIFVVKRRRPEERMRLEEKRRSKGKM